MKNDLELEKVELHTSVFVAIGAASTCWENLRGAGVFDSEQAKNIADQLLDRINQEVEKVKEN